MRLKDLLPRRLFGRAALILIVPIITIQLVVSKTFIQRHFERVTLQLSEGVKLEMNLLLSEVEAAATLGEAQKRLARLGRAFAMKTELPAEGPIPLADRTLFYDLSGRVAIATLREDLPQLGPIDLVTQDRVQLLYPTRFGEVAVWVNRDRVSASNPHQLLVLMIVTSVLMTVIAFVFLSNQLRPIQRLAAVAEAFGRGESLPYRPRGALEVRAAGHAFLDMRARIERQIEQRTLMLSGVSHDLRTPLTRLRLGLSLLPDDEETQALLSDVADMERLVDEFLAFARGDATEDTAEVDPVALARRAVENAERAGQAVALVAPAEGAMVRLRPQAVARALENLVGNGIRHGNRVVLTVALTDRFVRFRVEDDGPGIPDARRDEAILPFARLDLARDPNRGGGAGLGLSIASDIARSHGGDLRLSRSESLGGLRADLTLAR